MPGSTRTPLTSVGRNESFITPERIFSTCRFIYQRITRLWGKIHLISMNRSSIALRWQYSIGGFLFGCLFPVLGGIIHLAVLPADNTLHNWLSLQTVLPLMWVVDMAPLVLATFAFIIGHKQAQLKEYNQQLSGALDERVAELKDTNAQLQAEVSQRAQTQQDLQGALAEAERASKAKTEFLSTMSHEIRTPLNAVIGMTGLLLDTALSGQQVDFVRTIKVGGESLLSVINDILDYSKIESGMLELEEQAFNTLDPLEDVADLLAGKVHTKGLELVYDVAEDVPPAIFSDLTRLRQVLVNLVGNAIKFTEQGEIQVRASLTALQDEVATIQFSVSDTGIGIPQDRLNRLFKSFSQADASTTRKYGGTGLGLAICKKIVHHMGGDIWVESEVGKGSTFHFTIVARQAPARQFQLLDALSVFKGKHVVLVDDNRTNLDIIQRQCQNWGFKTTCFLDPIMAQHFMIQSNSIDLVITDMQMPSLDGVELTRNIREQSDKTAPFILLSSLGHHLPEDQKKLFDYILTKPAKTEQLFNAMARTLGWNRSQEPPTSDQQASQTRENQQLKLLLAEDNPVNQKVACHMLRKLDQDPDLAGNGLEAFELVKQFSYDLILMDMQMPEMDGITATKAILAHCQETNKRPPIIIAMTANSSNQDREACLDAGMKDFLSKPVQKKSLQNLIQKWGELALSTQPIANPV